MAPGPALDGFDWASQKMLSLRRGRGEASDHVSITGAFAGIAETGTLVTASGPEHPVTLNLLPDTHIVVLREGDIVGGYEDVWGACARATARTACRAPSTPSPAPRAPATSSRRSSSAPTGVAHAHVVVRE